MRSSQGWPKDAVRVARGLTCSPHSSLNFHILLPRGWFGFSMCYPCSSLGWSKTCCMSKSLIQYPGSDHPYHFVLFHFAPLKSSQKKHVFCMRTSPTQFHERQRIHSSWKWKTPNDWSWKLDCAFSKLRNGPCSGNGIYACEWLDHFMEICYTHTYIETYRYIYIICMPICLHKDMIAHTHTWGADSGNT